MVLYKFTFLSLTQVAPSLQQQQQKKKLKAKNEN